jgi:hypothetical protein
VFNARSMWDDTKVTLVGATFMKASRRECCRDESEQTRSPVAVDKQFEATSSNTSHGDHEVRYSTSLFLRKNGYLPGASQLLRSAPFNGVDPCQFTEHALKVSSFLLLNIFVCLPYS